ncbi:hypothetical protein RIR_jg23467.t1 [Rhizophagus irregularis DAOM 181602=DAOM 197198]|nr:hypothetical protein RIR_jg23467.t1 [Rhizophagus irregularis DAOM 181602=DAOM 197198]
MSILILEDVQTFLKSGNVGIGHRDLDIQTHTTYTVSQGKLPAHCGLRDKHSPTRSYAILFAMSTSRYWYF